MGFPEVKTPLLIVAISLEKIYDSTKLTYPLPRDQGTLEHDFPFPKVGYVSFLEGDRYLEDHPS